MKNKVLRVVSLLFACAVIVAGIDLSAKTAQAASKKATKITLTETKKTLYVGQTATLKVKSVKPGNASKKVTWKTSNKKFATVKNGKVTAKKAGTATITAVSTTNKKAKASCKITVKNPSTSFTKKSLTVNAADKTDLRKYIKVYGKSKSITWTTSNKKVATVSKKGVVTFKKPGTVTITAKANGKKASIKLKAPKLTISKTQAAVWYPTTKTVSLSAAAYGTNGKKTAVKWSTSNSKIATVSSSGKVTIKKAGTVTIYAKANGLTKTCKITARQETIRLNTAGVSLYPTQSYRVTASVTGTSKAVAWTTSNAGVATVSGGMVKAVKAGTATITARANGVTATCRVTVKAPDLKLSRTAVSLVKGETAAVTATVTGASRTVTWKSEAPQVASVNASGVITAKAKGTATITATANGVTRKVSVTVADTKTVTPAAATVSTDKGLRYTFSKNAAAFTVADGSQVYTATADELLAVKARIKELTAAHKGDIEGIFNEVGKTGASYTVAGRTVTIDKASKNAKTITVKNVNSRVNGTYDVTVAKAEEGKYTFTAKNTATNGARKVTVSVSLTNGIYTITAEERSLHLTFTFTVKADATSAVLSVNNGIKVKTVASYTEEKSSYVVTYNREYVENNLPMLLSQLSITDMTAEEILARADALIITEQY